MNSKVTGDKTQISSLLAGLELACADDTSYVCRRLARLSLNVFDDVVTQGGASEHDLFDVEAVLSAMMTHPEVTAAQTAIIHVALAEVLALAEGPNNPADITPTAGATDTPAPVQQLDFETVLEHGGQVAKMALLDAATDIEACAEALFEQAHNVAFEGEITAGAIIRTYASRIKAMNSLVISYVGPDAITLDDAFAAIHGPVLGIELLTRQLDHARVSVPAETVPAEVRATDGDYMAGVRLARALVVKGNLMSRAKPLDESFNLMSCYREDPDGTENPQNNWALSAVRSLIGNPAMAEGFAAVLSDAFACYDVDLPMYRAEDLTLAKIKGSISASAASAPSPEQDFMEGLRLAVDIVKAGKELAGSDADRCELSAKYRGGAQQDNFALPFIGQLVQLAEFPALLEGFSAVMSNIFAAQIVPGPDELNALTYFDIHRPLTAEQAAELVEEESKALDAAHAARTATPKASKAAKAPKKTSIKSGSKALAA